MTLLYLIRHGATAANDRRPVVLQGDAIDLGLNDRGRAQALATAEFLRDVPFVAVYSSHMLRARETAAAIAAGRDFEPQVLSGLQECNVGRFEGLDWGTIAERYGEACRLFHSDPGLHPMLDGESYGDVRRRALPVVEELLERHAGESFAVVSHNVVNRVILAHYLRLPLKESFGLHQNNCGVNLLRVRGKTVDVLTVNSFAHTGPVV